MLPRSCSLLTLVQGREVWRLVGAEHEPSGILYIHEVTSLLKRFIRGEGSHVSLYDRMISFLANSTTFEEQSARLLLYYITLVELGYADAKVIGVKDIKEYESLTVDDLYVRLLLTKQGVRVHVQEVLKEMHL